MILNKNDIGILSPEILLVGFIVSIITFGAIYNKSHRQKLITSFSLISLLIVFVSLLISKTGTTFDGLFVNNDFTKIMKSIVILAILVALSMGERFRSKNKLVFFEYPVIVLFAVLGMLLIISANNFISVYIGIELQSLSLYVLTAIKRDSNKSSEAGLKYFILGALASGIFLYGVGLLYGFSGSTDFNIIQSYISSNEKISPGLLIGMIFILSGIAFKLSVAPFHMWTPDVYEGSPSSVTAILAAVPKIAAMALLIRILYQPLLGMTDSWQQIIIAISILSMLVGALTALRQTNIKRLLAYGAIGNMGYALIGVATTSETGIAATNLYMILYSIMSLGVFSFVLAINKEGVQVEEITDFAGLAKSHPSVAAILAVLMFSMAGLPPFGGFIAKFYIFMAAVEENLAWLAIIGILTSVVASFYYLRIVKIIYFDELEDSLSKPLEKSTIWPAYLSAFAMIFSFIYIETLIFLSEKAALSIF